MLDVVDSSLPRAVNPLSYNRPVSANRIIEQPNGSNAGYTVIFLFCSVAVDCFLQPANGLLMVRVWDEKVAQPPLPAHGPLRASSPCLAISVGVPKAVKR